MRRGPGPAAAPVATPRGLLGEPQPAGRAAGDSSRCSSAAWQGDEASQSNLPVPCFQPTPGGRTHARQHKRKASLGGGSDAGAGSPCGRRRSTEVADALCEAGLADRARRKPAGDAGAFSSCSASRGGSDQRDSCSESEAGPWQAGFLREGSCSGTSSRGSRLRGRPAAQRRQPRAQVQPKDEWPALAAGLEATSSADAPAAQGSGTLSFPLIPPAQGSPAMPAGQAGGRAGRRRGGAAAAAAGSRAPRTSRFTGVGSSNRRNQWQARILVHGKVTHLGYYGSEEAAARVYDRVALALHGPGCATNFPAAQCAGGGELRGLGREDLQRALGVRPMEKSSRFRGVSRKKGKWEAKVMVNRRWAFRQLFDDEGEAARAYDAAVRRLKPREAAAFCNFGAEGAAAQPPPAGAARGKKARSRAQGVRFSADAGPPPPAPAAALSLSLSLPAQLGAVRTAPLAPEDLGDCSSLAPVRASLAPAGSSLARACELSPQHSAMRRRASFSGAPQALSLSLPDPHSIGVPPPSLQLPFPELVASSCDGLQQQQQQQPPPRALLEGLPPAGPLLPGCGLPLRPALAVDLPTIPPPLLPVEASRLSRAMSNSSLAACTPHAPQLPQLPHSCALPNPFQDVSAGHALPLPLPALASCSTGFRSLAEPPRPPSALASQGGAALSLSLSRAASGSVLRGLECFSRPPDALQRVQSHGGAEGLQLPLGAANAPLTCASRPPPAPVPPSAFGDLAPPAALQQQLQQPCAGTLPLAAAALPRTPSAASTRTLAGEQLTAQLSASSHQIAACLQPASVAAAAPLLPLPQPHPLPPYGEACAGLPFSAPLAPGFPGLPALHPLALADLQAKGCDVEATGLREDAADIMAQLGVDVREGEAAPPLACVHIGGEELSCLFPAP